MDRKPVRFVHRIKPFIRRKSYGTFDLETRGLGGPFLDASVHVEGGDERYRTLEELVGRMLTPPWGVIRSKKKAPKQDKTFWWFAHNGAKYDFTYIVTMIRNFAVNAKLTVDTVQQGTKIIALVIPMGENKIWICDSVPLLQATLEDASAAYAPRFGKLPHCPDHDFTKSDDMFYDPDCKICVQYLYRDSEALWYVLKAAWQVIIDVFGVTPGLTTGSTAVRAWMAMIPEGHVYWRLSESKEEFCRKAGTGSIIYPGYTSDKWVAPEGSMTLAALTFDRTAAFAACQLEGGYPVGTPAWTKKWHEDLFGFWHVRVFCPDGTFPVIPYTTPLGQHLFKTGSGEAYITSDQFRAARAAGYMLVVIQGLVWDKTEDVFGDFIRKCQDLEYPPDGSTCSPAVKAMVKNMRNSLNGKFNIRETMDRVYFGEPPVGSMPVLDEDGNTVEGIYSVSELVEAPYCHPEWYAITVTRQQLCMIGLARIIAPVCGKIDTDSITMSPESAVRLLQSGELVIGRLYGTFKVEHYWMWLQSIGPKNYRGKEQKNLAGGDEKFVNYCKGIPRKTMALSPEAHEAAGDGVAIKVAFTSTRSQQDMVKHNLREPAIVRTRSISTPASCMAWVHDPVTHRFSPHHTEVLVLSHAPV